MRDRMTILSKERIVEELNKILITPHPSMGFKLMDETGLLEYILPDLLKLKGVESVDGKGHKEIFSTLSRSLTMWRPLRSRASLPVL